MLRKWAIMLESKFKVPTGQRDAFWLLSDRPSGQVNPMSLVLGASLPLATLELKPSEYKYCKERGGSLRVLRHERLEALFMQQSSCPGGHRGAWDPQLCLSERLFPAGLCGKMLFPQGPF